MENLQYTYQEASMAQLERRWDKNIAENPGNDRWIAWKAAAMEDNMRGICKTFLVLHGEDPVGEGTLVFSPGAEAIRGRLALADQKTTVNINALRIEKQHEGKGHISRLVKTMERYAQQAGYAVMTIGVEAKETRNLGIYLHWGYTTFVMGEIEEDELVLYYSKRLL